MKQQKINVCLVCVCDQSTKKKLYPEVINTDNLPPSNDVAVDCYFTDRISKHKKLVLIVESNNNYPLQTLAEINVETVKPSDDDSFSDTNEIVLPSHKWCDIQK